MILAVVGTGTGVGKTTVSLAIVAALRGRVRVGAWKPIETGGDADGRALSIATGADAGPSLALRDPVAPSVAARSEGRVVDLESLAEEGRRRAGLVEVLVVELAGGLYSPLRDDGSTNAELVRALAPDRVIVVAANRLGVLHDVEACRRAMAADGLGLDLVVLSRPGDDLSVLSNASELRSVEVLEMPSTEPSVELVRWLDREIVSRGTVER